MNYTNLTELVVKLAVNLGAFLHKGVVSSGRELLPSPQAYTRELSAPEKSIAQIGSQFPLQT